MKNNKWIDGDVIILNVDNWSVEEGMDIKEIEVMKVYNIGKPSSIFLKGDEFKIIRTFFFLNSAGCVDNVSYLVKDKYNEFISIIESQIHNFITKKEQRDIKLEKILSNN